MTEEASAAATALCPAGVVAFVASLGLVVPVLALGSVVVGGFVARVVSFGSAVAPGFAAGAGGAGFFAACGAGLPSSLVGGFGDGAAIFAVTAGLGLGAGVTMPGFDDAGSSARRGVLVAGGPSGTAVVAGLEDGRGGARFGAREESLVMTRAIATPVATAEIPTVSQLRVARAGGVGKARRASCELAGMGGGSGVTIEVAS